MNRTLAEVLTERAGHAVELRYGRMRVTDTLVAREGEFAVGQLVFPPASVSFIDRPAKGPFLIVLKGGGECPQ